jgi:hypothetical protein
LWRLTANPAAPDFVACWTNNGQRPAFGLVGSAANQPFQALQEAIEPAGRWIG